MLCLFGHKKSNIRSMELPNYNDEEKIPYDIEKRTRNCSDGKMNRLMELIGYAINEWAVEYHLENMPKKVIFEQALDVMYAMELAMNNHN